MQVPPGAEGIRFARPTSSSGNAPKPGSAPTVRRLPQEGGLVEELHRKSREGIWCPSFSVAFRLLVLVRVCAAMYSSVVQDCDEVYNYWEPLHFLLHGDGFRTWEYSSKYAIRSWAYLLLHTLPARLVTHLNPSDKRVQFFATRLALAAASSLCEAKFYRSIAEHISPRIGRYTLIFLCFSAGMYNAAVSFLPSTFSMYLVMLGHSYALQPVNASTQRTLYATLCFTTAAILGWPFSIILAVPFVAEELFIKGAESSLNTAKRIGRLLKNVHLIGAIVAGVVAVDSYFYGRTTLVAWNIIKYNVLAASSETGPELYGTEPWYFYFLNGFLNLNLILLLALAAFPALLITMVYEPRRLGPNSTAQSDSSTLLVVRLLPFYIWFAVLSRQAHKEERFLHPAYPLICMNAAITLGLFRGWMENYHLRTTKAPFRTARASIFKYVTGSVLCLSSLLSVARVLALQHYFRAPMPLLHHLQYRELPKLAIYNYPSYYADRKITLENFLESEERFDIHILDQQNLTLCYGDEWYRFPSSFLVPNEVRVEFIKSNFKDQLPKHFAERRGERASNLKSVTAASPEGYNDLNLEETDRYIPVETCSYLVDLDYPLRHIAGESSSDRAPRYAVESDDWHRVMCLPFVDLQSSARLSRSFYLPFLNDGNTYGDYCLLRNRKIVNLPDTV